jgi:BASS family bile acid:Na+ symporter
MASNLSLIVMFVAYFVAYYDDVSGVIGTGGALAAILLVGGAFGVGYLMGGPDMERRKVLALGTGQRNLAAAFAVASSNFASNPDVLIEVMDVSVLGLALLMVIAAYLARHSGAGAGSTEGQSS